ncbi:ATP-binding protein [Streptomyces sp. ZAF1911]|uniref:AAA family ATPase n=1 Tax=Streptomyces sp. ZAF1911 TaxID=2944129 RepID=UPI00237BAF6F|nr:AAA family ATPase [Streptomyces sp. ZAF1911]MDD9382825.1 ATP-binding protein [Streptomyces sp. ZAF1911]
MIVWLNGPFGGGKTQTAHALHRRVAESVVCDPEHVGFGLHRMMPLALRGDFQDLPAWRQGVFEVLDLAAREHPGVVIVPMTVTDSGYFAETVGRLRERGHDVCHFALPAERETVLRRLRERGLGRGLKREGFAVARLDGCLEALREEEFAEHVETDLVGVTEVAERVAASAGPALAPDTDGALRGRIRRALVGVRHIRFD